MYLKGVSPVHRAPAFPFGHRIVAEFVARTRWIRVWIRTEKESWTWTRSMAVPEGTGRDTESAGVRVSRQCQNGRRIERPRSCTELKRARIDMDGKQAQDSSHEPSRPVQRFDKTLRGRKVISADGQVVGEITDLVVNSDQWQVESVQLKLNNAVADTLGVRRGKFHAGTIDIPVRMIQSVGDAIVLAVPTSALRPSLTGSHGAAA